MGSPTARAPGVAFGVVGSAQAVRSSRCPTPISVALAFHRGGCYVRPLTRGPFSWAWYLLEEAVRPSSGEGPESGPPSSVVGGLLRNSLQLGPVALPPFLVASSHAGIPGLQSHRLI